VLSARAVDDNGGTPAYAENDVADDGSVTSSTVISVVVEVAQVARPATHARTQLE
jgi:hypothetical protein